MFQIGRRTYPFVYTTVDEVTLAPGALTILSPGVVCHATDLVEHTELVADRLNRFGELVGREHVIAGADFSLGGHVHPVVGSDCSRQSEFC
jgi:5-methyltetrahydropteroyltriglutamate--homocysteine methyltransferase